MYVYLCIMGWVAPRRRVPIGGCERAHGQAHTHMHMTSHTPQQNKNKKVKPNDDPRKSKPHPTHLNKRAPIHHHNPPQKVVRLLLGLGGADPTLRDREGHTPLALAKSLEAERMLRAGPWQVGSGRLFV